MEFSQDSKKQFNHFGEISEICNYILKELKESNGNDQPITTLRNVCGKICCCRNVLNTSQLMESIFPILCSLDNHFVTNYYNENSLEIAILSKNILQNRKYYSEARHILEKSIQLILTNMKTEDECNLLMNVWNSSYITGSFPLPLIEMFIRKLPKCVEDDVISTVDEILKVKTIKHNAWTQPRDVLLIKWCSLSRNIFNIITSILNRLVFQVMFRTKQFNLCIKIVSTFIVKVKESCETEEEDFVLLYPRQLQSVIVVLELDPNYLSQCGHELFSSTIIQLNQYLKTEPTKTFTLLSHFPKWAVILNKCLTL